MSTSDTPKSIKTEMTPEEEIALLKEDLNFYDSTCTLCMNPDIGPPWRHDHYGDGKFHWHHCIDPGDGLVDPCKNSWLLEEIFDEEITARDQRIAELEAQLLEAHERTQTVQGLLNDACERREKRIKDLEAQLQKSQQDAINANKTASDAKFQNDRLVKRITTLEDGLRRMLDMKQHSMSCDSVISLDACSCWRQEAESLLQEKP